MMHKSMFSFAMASMAAMALCACHSAPTRIHTLEKATPAARVDSYQAPPLRVDSVHVPLGWDRLEILSPTGAGELKIDDFDHWSAPLAQLVRQVLSADLDARLPSGTVIFPHLSKPPGALGINVDILEFTLDSSQGSMSAGWSITPGVGSPVTRREVSLFHTPLASADPTAVAHAWSTLLGKLADRIAADAAKFSAP
jgi:uncharacterized lipoprotein YmbA